MPAKATLSLRMAKDVYGNYVVGVTLTPAIPPSPSTGGGGVGETLTGTDADPNGTVTPSDLTAAAWYYQDPATTPYNVWYWDVPTQAWVQFSAPA